MNSNPGTCKVRNETKAKKVRYKDTSTYFITETLKGEQDVAV